MLTIAEEVLLLVLDDDTGKLSASLPVHALRNAVASALLMDLALSDRIDTDLHKLILRLPSPCWCCSYVVLARSPILNLAWKWICVWLAGKRKLQVTRRFRVVALQSIGAIAVARDNSMSRTAFETSRPIRSILRT